MILKLKNKKPKDISVHDMKDGEIAVITLWPCRSYIGDIVQRLGKELILLGKGRESSWPDVFEDNRRWEDYRVRVLEKGEELVVGE